MPKKKQKSKTVQSRRPIDGPLHELAEQVAVGLTPSQSKALLALIAGKKKQDAARIAAVHPNRIGIWLTNDPYFFAAYYGGLEVDHQRPVACPRPEVSLGTRHH